MERHRRETTPLKVEEAQVRPELLFFRRAAQHVDALWAHALDLLFPPRCALCGRVDTVLCAECQQRFATLPAVVPLVAIPPLQGACATGIHEGALQELVHTLKYASDRYTARALAAILAKRLTHALQSVNWTIDMIVPMPLHTNRQKERGYNQSQLLALALAHQSGIPASMNALIRWRPTRSQVGLNREERLTNVRDAFRADPTLVSGRVVLILDDVCTTGASLSACAGALTEAGAVSVYSLTVTAAKRTTRINSF